MRALKTENFCCLKSNITYIYNIYYILLLYVHSVYNDTGTMVSYRKCKRTIDSNIAVELQEPNYVEHLFEQFLAGVSGCLLLHALITKLLFIVVLPLLLFRVS